MDTTTSHPAFAPRALTRSEGRVEYYYGLVVTVVQPAHGNLDDAVWRSSAERVVQRSYQQLHGQPAANVRIVRVEETSDGVVVVAHHDQVLKGLSARPRGTQAGRKHRVPAQEPFVFVSLQRWVVPALRLSLLDAA